MKTNMHSESNTDASKRPITQRLQDFKLGWSVGATAIIKTGVANLRFKDPTFPFPVTVVQSNGLYLKTSIDHV